MNEEIDCGMFFELKSGSVDKCDLCRDRKILSDALRAVESIPARDHEHWDGPLGELLDALETARNAYDHYGGDGCDPDQSIDIGRVA